MEHQILLKCKNQVRANFIWNMIGNICFAMMSIVLLIFVTNIAGKEMGGIFSIAFSISQLLSTVGVLGVRQFQATDIFHKYYFTNYFLGRIITTALMVVVAIVTALLGKYEEIKVTAIILLSLYRVGESLCASVEDDFQQNDRLYVSGKIQTLRTVVPTALFVLFLFVTRDIIWSCFVYMMSSLLIFILFCTVHIKEKFSSKEISFKQIFKILKSCMPLFCSVFMATFIVNVPKYLLDEYGGSQIQIIYSIIAMPTFAVNLLSEFFSKPYMVQLSMFWNNKDMKPFNRRLKKILLTMTVITLAIVIGGNVIGLYILQFMYSIPEVLHYSEEFMIILIGAGINAGALFFSGILVVFRKQGLILAAYIVTGISTLIFGRFFIREYAVAGAAWTFFFSSLLLFAMFIISFLVSYLKRGDNNEVLDHHSSF